MLDAWKECSEKGKSHLSNLVHRKQSHRNMVPYQLKHPLPLALKMENNHEHPIPSQEERMKAYSVTLSPFDHTIFTFNGKSFGPFAEKQNGAGALGSLPGPFSLGWIVNEY